MIHNNLIFEERALIGNQVRKLKKLGIIPAVIYGKGRKESLHIQLNLNNFLKVFKVAGKTTVLDLTTEGDSNKIPCLVHALDVDPVKNTLRHIDFLEVDLKKKITSFVPILFEGTSPAIKEFGAVLSKNVSEIEIECLPDKIPQNIIVDLSKMLTLDDVIRVEDLAKNADYEIISENDEVIASLVTATQEVLEDTSIETVIETGADSPNKAAATEAPKK